MGYPLAEVRHDSLQAMADALPDEFADYMALIGTKAECREKMARMNTDGPGGP